MSSRIEVLETHGWISEPSVFVAVDKRDGGYVNIGRIWSYPKPVQQPHPPVILGAFGGKWGRQRAADNGDGWIPIDVFHKGFSADVADLNERLLLGFEDVWAFERRWAQEQEDAQSVRTAAAAAGAPTLYASMPGRRVTPREPRAEPGGNLAPVAQVEEEMT